MSTKKIFLVFGLIVILICAPLLSIYIVAPHLFGRYIGLVENSIASLVGAFIVALALDYTIRRRQEKAIERVACIGLSEISTCINRLIALFGGMVKASSSTFSPSNIKDLYGTEAAELISLHLDLAKPAPVSSKTPWVNYIKEEIKRVNDSLVNINTYYQAYLPEDTIIAIGTLQNNTVLKVFSSFSIYDSELDIKYPVFNIEPEKLNFYLAQIENSINIIQQSATKLKSKKIVKFPDFTFKSDVEPFPGSARYDGEAGPMTYIDFLPTAPENPEYSWSQRDD